MKFQKAFSCYHIYTPFILIGNYILFSFSCDLSLDFFLSYPLLFPFDACFLRIIHKLNLHEVEILLVNTRITRLLQMSQTLTLGPQITYKWLSHWGGNEHFPFLLLSLGPSSSPSSPLFTATLPTTS